MFAKRRNVYLNSQNVIIQYLAQFWIFLSFLGEIIKALEQSEALVPADLREVWDNYKQKQAEDGKSVKTGGGGFGGSGFKFDESEAAYTSEKKKFQKTVFGLQDSDDEDVEGEIDDQIEVRISFSEVEIWHLTNLIFCLIGSNMVFRAIILKRGYVWSALTTTTTMS